MNSLNWDVILPKRVSPEPYRFQKSLFSGANQELVRRLREARKRAGLSQIEVAKRLGCRQAFISKMECGDRRIDVAELLLLLREYGSEPGEFLKNLLPKTGGATAPVRSSA